ncbi:phosphate ABC transporter substrate-binding protein [Clostridiisalibacter paucivorans]|uniref:phosphate ABC transporter substrate-binding protein n=1 Tax=Clostridiisalibacter paucivorans TaxID=408753 RepID=UPI00047EA28A|nr:phosphate ABC transporter substrate-binding protein [Clostridiisalibacter paucivorans]
MKSLRNSKMIILVMVLLLSISVFVGCSGENDSNGNDGQEQSSDNGEGGKTGGESDGLEGTISIAGSTSVTPLAEKLAAAFMEANPNVKIDVQGIGSSAGVKASNEGAADIGMASRNLKEAEKEWGLTEHIIAYDGIAVVVHPSNDVEGLDKEMITKIFKGEIKNWKEVGGKDDEILVVSREAGSGTRGAFEGIMDLEEKNDDGKKISAVRQDALIAEGNGAVRQNIAGKENAIGYISLSYMNESVKGVKVEGVEPTVEKILAGEYKVSRPFLMLTKGDMNQLVKAYMDFVMSDEGQEIVSEKGIPVK